MSQSTQVAAPAQNGVSLSRAISEKEVCNFKKSAGLGTNMQGVCCFIKIQHPILCLLDEVDKFLG
jgi:hypothetical protein